MNRSRGALSDHTESNNPQNDRVYWAFGEQAEEGSRLYIGLPGRFFFRWRDVPGCYNDRVRVYLADTLGLVWARKARIQKSSNSSEIRVSRGERSVSFSLNEKKGEVQLKTGETVIKFLAEKKKREWDVFTQPFAEERPISLTFNLFDNYPIERGFHLDEPPAIEPSAATHWEYSDSSEVWQPINLVTDKTQHLSQSGRITACAPAAWWVRSLTLPAQSLNSQTGSSVM